MACFKAADSSVLTLYGVCTERVTSYKYLGLWLDEKQPFNAHVGNPLKELQPKPAFVSLIRKSAFSLQSERKLNNIFFTLR